VPAQVARVDVGVITCSNAWMDATDLAQRFSIGGAARLSDGPVARGKQGVVWRLDTDMGRWALKVPFGSPSEEQVASATAFHEAAHAAGVPTPRVLRTDDGAVFAPFNGGQARLYEWVDLLPPDRFLDPAQVGAVVAAIHRVPTPDGALGALDPFFCEPVGADRWDHVLDQLTTEGAPFASRLAELRDELVALESWIEPPRRLLTCHRDLWADNVLGTADGGVCVIDWEESGPADPSQELGYVLFEFAGGDPGRARDLVTAYRDAGGPATVSRRGDFTMLIAQLGHIIELAAKDWLTPNLRSPQRADAVAWISEALDDPHTREVLDPLLAAVDGSGDPGP
jgi:aminoglycoside phosphotransferase (APT) family kinase protein